MMGGLGVMQAKYGVGIKCVIIPNAHRATLELIIIYTCIFLEIRVFRDLDGP